MTKTNGEKVKRTDGKWLRWTPDEQQKFWSAYNRVGTNWVAVSKEVTSRDRI